MKPCGMQNQISLYLDGQLTGEALRRFEDHLQSCEGCAGEVEQMQSMLRQLNALPELEVPAGLTDRLHAALLQEARKGTVRMKRKFNPWIAMPVAAALVVCVAGGTLLLGSLGQRHSPAQLNSVRMSDNMNLTGGTDADVEKAKPAATMAPAAMAPEAPSPEKGLTATGGETNDALAGAMDSAIPDLSQQQSVKAPAENNRKLIYNANLALETREFDSTLTTLQGIMTKYNGYVENNQISGVPEGTYGGARSASYTMRFPISNYGDAIGDLTKMGNLLSRNESVEDISRQYVDTDARNKALTLQRDKLNELMTKANTMENTIALENEITRLTTEIEQMTGQLRFWDNQVAYSTVTINIQEILTPKKVEPADPDLSTRRSGAFYDTINRMRGNLEQFTVDFMGALPWIIVIAIPLCIAAGIAWPLIHRARRRARLEKASKEE